MLMKSVSAKSSPAFVLVVTLASCLFLISSCGRDSADPTADAHRTLLASMDSKVEPTGGVVGYSGCKTFEQSVLTDEIASFQTAIAWEYDGEGTLYLQHLNGCFNACFVEISCDITFDDRSIVIAEHETIAEQEECTDLCLVDVDFEITGLSPGKYVIRVNELHFQAGDEVIEFEVLLKGTGASGIFILDRCHYPWMEESNPTWEVIDWDYGMGGWAACLVEWEYSDNGVLHLLSRTNLNWCCPTDLTVDISYENGAFLLNEIVVDPGFHWTVLSYCWYDVEISDLLPGTYQFTFTGFTTYAAWPVPIEIFDPLELTIDLVAQPSGSYCIEL